MEAKAHYGRALEALRALSETSGVLKFAINTSIYQCDIEELPQCDASSITTILLTIEVLTIEGNNHRAHSTNFRDVGTSFGSPLPLPHYSDTLGAAARLSLSCQRSAPPYDGTLPIHQFITDQHAGIHSALFTF